jgi:ribosomal protein S27E
VDNALCCTKCGEIVIKSVGGDTKIRSKVLVFKENQTLAICKGCNVEIPVPVSIDETMVKSLKENAKLRLYVRK